MQLANFSTNLDLEVTGDFLFDHLADPDDALQMTRLANRTLTCKLASEVGKARGNDKWVTTYGADATEALDDLIIALSKEKSAQDASPGPHEPQRWFVGGRQRSQPLTEEYHGIMIS